MTKVRISSFVIQSGFGFRHSGLKRSPVRPTQHPTFEPLPTPEILRVPLTPRGGVEAPTIRPAGTKVAAGERLATAVSQFDPWPVSPVAAEIVGTCSITLTNGRSVPAVELST